MLPVDAMDMHNHIHRQSVTNDELIKACSIRWDRGTKNHEYVETCVSFQEGENSHRCQNNIHKFAEV